jgi:HK97 family phage portal protein
MKLFNWLRRRPDTTEAKINQFEDVLQRIVALQEGTLGGNITPETCMKSPTVHAIVTAVSRRLAVTPVHVLKKGTKGGREYKEPQPNHSVAKLLQSPNPWQTRYDFWIDAASTFLRWGRFFAFKARGTTGPIRQLVPLHPRSVTPRQDENWNVTFEVAMKTGESMEYQPSKIFHARSMSRDYLTGDSPVTDVSTTIALEIMAEEFGYSFFKNGALPLVIFQFMAGAAGFKDPNQQRQFVQDFQEALGGNNRHKALLLPKNIDVPKTVPVEHDKAQFIETRKHQRTVIAGAFGVPPHLVGDLEQAHYNNVEQQDKDFTVNVVLPVAQAFEAAMERDLLTREDRAAGIIIRFNLDSVLRADFKSRQEGLRLQRESGVISANEWREMEGMNPLSPEDGGDDYIRPMNMATPGEEPETTEDQDDAENANPDAT